LGVNGHKQAETKTVLFGTIGVFSSCVLFLNRNTNVEETERKKFKTQIQRRLSNFKKIEKKKLF
jgi:hypothetical protein